MNQPNGNAPQGLKLYVMTVYQLNSQNKIELYFNDLQRAHDASSKINSGDGHTVKDDYGSYFYPMGGVAFALLTDIEEKLKGNEVIAIIKARADQALQRRGEADPLLNQVVGLPPGVILPPGGGNA